MKFVIFYLEAEELPVVKAIYSRKNVAEARLAEFKRGRDPRFDSWYWLETVSDDYAGDLRDWERMLREMGVFKAGA